MFTPELLFTDAVPPLLRQAPLRTVLVVPGTKSPNEGDRRWLRRALGMNDDVEIVVGTAEQATDDAWLLVVAIGTGVSKVLGSKLPHQIRAGIAQHPVTAVPVVCLPPWSAWRRGPRATLHHARWVGEEVEALFSRPRLLPDLSDVRYKVLHTLDDMREACANIRRAGGPVTWDTETFGACGQPWFRPVCLAFATAAHRVVYLLTEEAITAPGVGEEFGALVREFGHGGADIKYDLKTILGSPFTAEFRDPAGRGGRWFHGPVEHDTKFFAKLLDVSGSGKLDELGWQVGTGGHKGVMAEAMAKAEKALSLLRTAAAKRVPAEWHYEMVPYRKGKRRKQVVTLDRAQTRDELRLSLSEAWVKTRTITDPSTKEKRKCSISEYLGRPELRIPEDWLTAAADWDCPVKRYSYALMDRDVCHRYCAQDVWATVLLRAHLKRRMDRPDAAPMRRVWDSHLSEIPAAVARMEAGGMPFDEPAARGLSVKLGREIAGLEGDIRAALPDGYDEAFNPGSDDQVRRLLFDDLGLNGTKKTNTGKKSVDASVLKELKDAHPMVAKIGKFRELRKLRSTYADGLLSQIREDGRIHGSFNPMGAGTGRWSSSDPNLQNIPTRTDTGKTVKALFNAPPGYVLVQIDYSTLEVRIAALLAECETMRGAFWEDDGSRADFHANAARVASQVAWLDVPWDDADDAERARRRKIAKTIVFGTLFGQGTGGLARSLGISEDEASVVQVALFEGFAGLGKLKARLLRETRKDGYCWTWWQGQRARRRPMAQISSKDDGLRAYGERCSLNTPVQGTGSEFNTASVVGLWRVIDENGLDAQVIGAVHDSTVSLVHEADLDDYVTAAVRVMEGWAWDGVPTPVDVEFGKNWRDLSPYPVKSK